MDKLERKLYDTDFSKYTDLKSRLAGRLFTQKSNGKTTPFVRLSDSDVELVNAAQGLMTENPFKKNLTD